MPVESTNPLKEASHGRDFKPAPVNEIARLPIIDAARGAAALMVCALHARVIIWVGLGSCIRDRAHDNFLLTLLGILSAPLYFAVTSVSLFFVLSGYCIHRAFAIKLAADARHEPNWRDYFIRRLWRIYPVLIAVLLITLLLDQFTLQRFPQDSKLESLSWHTLVVNMCALQGVAGPSYGSNDPLWSLACEIQLYLVYPVVFYLIRRLGIDSCVWIILATSLLCAAANLLFGAPYPVWFGPYWFAWTLGCAVSEYVMAGRRLRLQIPGLAAWLLISLLGFGLCGSSKFGGLAFSFTGCFWALLLLKCLQTPVAEWCKLPVAWLAKVGIFSYSLYAVHKPVCLFIRSLMFHGAPSRNILYVLPVMGACGLVAIALFYSVERYSLRVPKWLQRS